MKDPYTILGVSRDATDEDIKKAYRTLARKYHPDNYAGSDLADVAEEKMKEINEAYDLITRMRASSNTGTYSGASSSGYTSGNYAEIRTRINEGRYSDAEILLDAIHASQRGAEWNFLKGYILLKRGHYVDAQRYFDTACSMDPYNQEYRAAQMELSRRANGYGSGYNTTTAGGCSGCDICSGLMCADCCCECCGGDLISCCCREGRNEYKG